MNPRDFPRYPGNIASRVERLKRLFEECHTGPAEVRVLEGKDGTGPDPSAGVVARPKDES